MVRSYRRVLTSSIIWLILAVLFGILFPFHVGAYQREPGDFRGLRWGSASGELPGATLASKDGSYAFFTSKDEKQDIGDAEVEKIVYGYYKDRLFSVMVYYKSLPNFLKLKDIYSQQYGPPDRPNEYMDKYFWNGETVDIFIAYEDIRAEGKISYMYKPIEKEIEADEKLEAKQGARDL
ncbi:MAG: hypothetical protein AB7W37_05605 [Syntrophobacteraceae bacterium]